MSTVQNGAISIRGGGPEGVHKSLYKHAADGNERLLDD
jgi:hypothetical protein